MVDAYGAVIPDAEQHEIVEYLIAVHGPTENKLRTPALLSANPWSPQGQGRLAGRIAYVTASYFRQPLARSAFHIEDLVARRINWN